MIYEFGASNRSLRQERKRDIEGYTFLVFVAMAASFAFPLGLWSIESVVDFNDVKLWVCSLQRCHASTSLEILILANERNIKIV